MRISIILEEVLKSVRPQARRCTCIKVINFFTICSLSRGFFFGQRVGTPKQLDAFIEDGETFSFEDEEIKTFLTTLHTPGHTPGSCCFYTEYFDEPMLLAGDTLFQQSIGRTDLPGGDGRQIIKSIKERLLTLPEETNVIAGHGPATNIYTEKKYNPFLC